MPDNYTRMAHNMQISLVLTSALPVGYAQVWCWLSARSAELLPWAFFPTLFISGCCSPAEGVAADTGVTALAPWQGTSAPWLGLAPAENACSSLWAASKGSLGGLMGNWPLIYSWTGLFFFFNFSRSIEQLNSYQFANTARCKCLLESGELFSTADNLPYCCCCLRCAVRAFLPNWMPSALVFIPRKGCNINLN